MGLDMYAYKTLTPVPAVDFKAPADSLEIAYWRKHPDLHGLMECLYRAKGGKEDSFNCVPVCLDLADLALIEHAVLSAQLPETVGFFFGVSQPEDIEIDLAFIKDAREAIAQGFQVFYDSWW